MRAGGGLLPPPISETWMAPSNQTAPSMFPKLLPLLLNESSGGTPAIFVGVMLEGFGAVNGPAGHGWRAFVPPPPVPATPLPPAPPRPAAPPPVPAALPAEPPRPPAPATEPPAPAGPVPADEPPEPPCP